MKRLRSIGSYLLVLHWLANANCVDGAEPIKTESVLLRIIDEVAVPANAAGQLAKLDVIEGASVAQGQELGRIDDFESQLMLKRAEIQLQLIRMQIANDVSVRTAATELLFARQNYARLKKAADSLAGSVSESELAQLELEVRRATLASEDAQRVLELNKATVALRENEVLSMRRRVEMLRVMAPLEGRIEQVFRRPGEWVKPGDDIVRIVSLRRIRAEGFVPVALIDGDLRGAPVKVMVREGKPRTFEGKVVFLPSDVDPVNGQVRVWAEIENHSGYLRPGMRAEMLIVPPPNKSSP